MRSFDPEREVAQPKPPAPIEEAGPGALEWASTVGNQGVQRIAESSGKDVPVQPQMLSSATPALARAAETEEKGPTEAEASEALSTLFPMGAENQDALRSELAGAFMEKAKGGSGSAAGPAASPAGPAAAVPAAATPAAPQSAGVDEAQPTGEPAGADSSAAAPAAAPTSEGEEERKPA